LFARGQGNGIAGFIRKIGGLYGKMGVFESFFYGKMGVFDGKMGVLSDF
jgi:hypothetical protein